MQLIHEFYIIEDINNQSLYSEYAPDLNDCIHVHDDIILELVDELAIMKTYFQSLDCPNFGLTYHGVTLIPPESLSLFLYIVLSNKTSKNCEDITKLCKKIQQAIKQNKYMIHYGI